MLKLTEFDKKIKLKDLARSWKFTRPESMRLKLLETLFYMIMSNTHNLIYACGIYSMYQNAGLFGLLYPLSIFGYALLEETRPRKEYWMYLQTYTIVLLCIKFVLNLQLMEGVLSNPSFQYVSSYLKIGIYDYEELG